MNTERDFKKNLFFIYCGAFLFFIIFHTSFTVVPLYLVEIGGDEFSLGLQSTVFFISGVILRLYFGPLADKKGRKLPLLIGTFVFFTTPLLFIAVSNHWMLIPVRIYQAIGLATFLSSGSSFVADIAPKEKTGTYIGFYRLVITMALLVGPAGAQVITNTYGFNTWFIISSILGVFAFLFIFIIKSPPLPENEKISSLNNILQAIKNKELWPIYLIVFLVSLGYGTILNFATVYISQVTEVTNPGIYFTIFALAGVAANLSVGFLSDRFGREVVVWPCVLALALGCLSFYLLPVNSIILVISGFLAGFGFSGSVAASIAWLIDKTKQGIRATVLSFQESAMDLAIALGAFLIGVSSKVLSLSLSFALTGIVILTMSALLIMLGRKVKSAGGGIS